jgi:hypothetical protein
MAELTGSVGLGGANAPHDVRLVQLMLRLISRKLGGSYFPDDHSGRFTGRLQEAIATFQQTEGVQGETAGLVAAGGRTWKALVARLPERLKEVRTCEGVSVAYLAMSDADFRASLADLRSPTNRLEVMFAHKLVNLVTEFHEKTGIALSVNKYRGWWRSLDDQVNLVSQGGPGESIHHFGLAVDVGFRGWQWVHPDGHVQKPDRGDFFTSGLAPTLLDELCGARENYAFDKLKLFTTNLTHVRAHIQAFEDAPVDSATSWIALLEAHGPRKMKWEPYEMTPTSYKCDLGLGGARYLVGTALDIWVLDPGDPRWANDLQEKHLDPKLRLKKSNLAKALNAKLEKDRSFSLDSFFGNKARRPQGRPLTAADFTDEDMIAVRKLLHREFEETAKHWREWKRVFYKSEERRPVHDKKLAQAPDPD